LGHVERCRILLHLIDATGEDPVAAWKMLRNELKAYGGDLYDKPEIVGLTKLDATPEDYAADLAIALQEAGRRASAGVIVSHRKRRHNDASPAYQCD
jgi:GTP-binding protein